MPVGELTSYSKLPLGVPYLCEALKWTGVLPRLPGFGQVKALIEGNRMTLTI